MKQSVSSLKKKAWKYFSLYIRYRDSEFKRGEWWCECITCGQEKPLKEMQAGHFVSRRVSSLLFDEENVNAQCPSCNVFKAGEQYLYAKALDLKYGNGKAEELMGRRFETHKFSIGELEQIIEDSKNQIKFYEEKK
jgi:hypothetical protein